MRHILPLLGVCLLLSSISFSPGAAPAPPAPPPAEALPARLAKPTKLDAIDDPKTTLAEVLDVLRDRLDIAIEVNEDAFKDDGQDALKANIAANRPLPKMTNVRLDQALNKILSRVPHPSGVTFLVRRDHLEITTWQAAKSEIWGPSYVGPFLPLVHATFDKKPLDQALKELADASATPGFNIVLDSRAADKARETQVTARLLNTPLDTAVRLLADMAELRPVLLDNVVYVTTRENAAYLNARLAKERGEGSEDTLAVPRVGTKAFPMPGAPR
jgi:hypothetical protein